MHCFMQSLLHQFYVMIVDERDAAIFAIWILMNTVTLTGTRRIHGSEMKGCYP